MRTLAILLASLFALLVIGAASNGTPPAQLIAATYAGADRAGLLLAAAVLAAAGSVLLRARARMVPA